MLGRSTKTDFWSTLDRIEEGDNVGGRTKFVIVVLLLVLLFWLFSRFGLRLLWGLRKKNFAWDPGLPQTNLGNKQTQDSLTSLLYPESEKSNSAIEQTKENKIEFLIIQIENNQNSSHYPNSCRCRNSCGNRILHNNTSDTFSNAHPFAPTDIYAQPLSNNAADTNSSRRAHTNRVKQSNPTNVEPCWTNNSRKSTWLRNAFRGI